MMNRVTKMQKWKVSIGIVYYNPTLEILNDNIKQMNRIIESSVHDVEVFFIDNASQNLDVYQFSNQTIKLISLNNNLGFGKGHNSVLDSLNTDVHLILNPDVEITSVQSFDQAVNFLMTNNFSMLSPLVKNTDGTIQRLTRNLPTVFDLMIRFMGSGFFPARQKKFVNWDTGYDRLQPIANATGSFMLVKTQILKKVGGFDERYFMYMEDTDLTRKLNAIAPAMFYPELSVTHAWKRDNHSIKGVRMMLKSMYQYFAKWGWRLI